MVAKNKLKLKLKPALRPKNDILTANYKGDIRTGATFGVIKKLDEFMQ